MTHIIPSTTIGLDFGDKKYAISALNSGDEIIDERTLANHLEALCRLSQNYPGAGISLEVGSHSSSISHFHLCLASRGRVSELQGEPGYESAESCGFCSGLWLSGNPAGLDVR